MVLMKQFPSLLSAVVLAACGGTTGHSVAGPADPTPQQPQFTGLSKAHFAEGCFWCSEEIFQNVRGVKAVINGYAGGNTTNPTYEEVSNGTTGHAESVEVYYDPKEVDFATLLKVFFASQDPTTPSRQGPDAGSQYRSIAFYDSPQQKAQIEAYIKQLDASGQYPAPIVTEVLPFTVFWPAEPEHQDYVLKHPDNPYVKQVSKPRFDRFKAKMPGVLNSPPPKTP